ncbi:MAG TPA: hypothetical protein VGV59_10960 [Pyrinomonadaceae bacterium]|nr:hypothetical protein [Pyrinomonadaceae bacterium]
MSDKPFSNPASDIADAATPNNPVADALNPENNPVVDALTPDGENPLGENPVVVQVTETVNTVVGVLQEVVGGTLDTIKKEALSQLSGEEQDALLNFVNAVDVLKERGASLEGLHERFMREVVGKSLQVATRAENMQLAANLFAATRSAYEALTSVFTTLKALTQLIPELGEVTELFPEEFKNRNPRFRLWVDSL